MQIRFRTTKLQKEMNEERRLRTIHGPRRAELIARRLAELEAAPCLEIVRRLPGPRCHELKGNRKGQLSVDLDHP
jgi:proteic killer suppression protein